MPSIDWNALLGPSLGFLSTLGAVSFIAWKGDSTGPKEGRVFFGPPPGEAAPPAPEPPPSPPTAAEAEGEKQA